MKMKKNWTGLGGGGSLASPRSATVDCHSEMDPDLDYCIFRLDLQNSWLLMLLSSNKKTKSNLFLQNKEEAVVGKGKKRSYMMEEEEGGDFG